MAETSPQTISPAQGLITGYSVHESAMVDKSLDRNQTIFSELLVDFYQKSAIFTNILRF